MANYLRICQNDKIQTTVPASSEVFFVMRGKGRTETDRLHAYVFMLNHIHLIVASEDVAGFIRDFKKFTSKQLRDNIEQTFL